MYNSDDKCKCGPIATRTSCRMHIPKRYSFCDCLDSRALGLKKVYCIIIEICSLHTIYVLRYFELDIRLSVYNNDSGNLYKHLKYNRGDVQMPIQGFSVMRVVFRIGQTLISI